jgi:DASS family divalent anion:Na+ symporter
VPALISISVGLLIRFVIPCPAGVEMQARPSRTPQRQNARHADASLCLRQAWSLLAIFLSTITGLVLEPLPVGAWAFLGLTAAIATKVLTFGAAFSAFTSDVIWLIVISFFFAKGFVKTGLGDRVANYFVTILVRSAISNDKERQ